MAPARGAMRLYTSRWRHIEKNIYIFFDFNVPPLRGMQSHGSAHSAMHLWLPTAPETIQPLLSSHFLLPAYLFLLSASCFLLPAFSFLLSPFCFLLSPSGFRVQRSGFRVQGSAFGVQRSAFSDQRLASSDWWCKMPAYLSLLLLP